MTRLMPALGRTLFTVLFVVAAIAALILVWRHYETDPWTRDGSVQADVVKVSSDVSGLLTQLRVHDNQLVRAGDVLFTVDEQRYAAKLAQAQAAVTSAKASVESAQANVAKDKVTLASDIRDQQRYLTLGNLVSQEDRDQKSTKVDQDRATLAQGLAQVNQALGSLAQAEANRLSAQIDVDSSTVRAGVSGYVTGFSLRPGNFISSGVPQFALVDIASYYVLGYFEETKLHRFGLGQQARINLLGDDRPLWGHVDSLSAGIADRQKNPSGELLPNITPTFSWIRLAQRVPVRVVIDQIPKGLKLVAGRSATVTVLPTARLVAPVPLPESAAPSNTAPLNRPLPPPVGSRETSPIS